VEGVHPETIGRLESNGICASPVWLLPQMLTRHACDDVVHSFFTPLRPKLFRRERGGLVRKSTIRPG
jgi:hypothetical protein